MTLSQLTHGNPVEIANWLRTYPKELDDLEIKSILINILLRLPKES